MQNVLSLTLLTNFLKCCVMKYAYLCNQHAYLYRKVNFSVCNFDGFSLFL